MRLIFRIKLINDIYSLIKVLMNFLVLKTFKYIYITSTYEIERMSAADYNFKSLQTCSNNASPLRTFQCFEINV